MRRADIPAILVCTFLGVCFALLLGYLTRDAKIGEAREELLARGLGDVSLHAAWRPLACPDKGQFNYRFVAADRNHRIVHGHVCVGGMFGAVVVAEPS